jgi:hypothetical protein
MRRFAFRERTIPLRARYIPTETLDTMAQHPRNTTILMGMDGILARTGRWLQDARHWPLLAGVLLLIPCGWFVVKMGEARKQKTAVEEIENLGGGVWYDYQFDAAGNEIQWAEPPGDPWLRRVLGDDFFINVTMLDLTQTDIPDAGLEHLEWLPKLQSLSLGACVTDAGLRYLERLPGLRTLNLGRSQVSDAGVKRLQRALPNCSIRR